MRNPIMEFSQVSRCLLCHDAPCTRACPGTDPARILRALRFENDLGAVTFPVETVAIRHCVLTKNGDSRF